MIGGNMERALEITEQVLERFPGDLHAQANRLQFLVRLGRREEAQDIAGRLRTVQPEDADDWHKLIEAFTYLGYDATVVSLYEALQKDKDDAGAADSPLIQHWAAVAYSRRDNDKQARKLWQKAQKTLRGLPEVEENLAELKKPAGERANAWPFAFQQWVPRLWLKELARIAQSERSESMMIRKTQQEFERNPSLAAAIPLLFERGNAESREFALKAAITFNMPVLAEFALSDHGTDAERLRAAQAAAEAGLLPRGRPVKMWSRGKLTDIIPMAYEVYEDLVPNHLPRRAQSLMEQAFEARMKTDFESALRLLDEALTLAPSNPTLMNHKAATLGLLGHDDEARAVVEQTAEMHPDYVFARCAMAEFLAQEGRLDEAHKWLDQLMEQPRFHVSEFSSLCKAQIEVLLAEGRVEGAKSWLQMFEQVNPDHYLLTCMRQRVKKGR
jgi:tetratricopeptide (TPR) repeat protein